MIAVKGDRRGAQAMLLLAAVASAAASAQTGEALELEEIIVTAQRRSETLQDVPVAVTALSSADLDQRDIRDYGAYLSTVPGAAVQETTGIGGEIKFRGVGTGINAQLSPTTAVYFGDVPVIHTGRNVNASYNFWLTDIDRVEVLRGPQGQLFGSNSLGGAIRNIPVRARPGEFAASVDLGGGRIEDGDDNYSVEGMVNLPFGEDAALRLVAYQVEQGGWYDNVFRGGPALGSLPPPPPGYPPPAPGGLLPQILALQPAAATYAAPAPANLEDTNSVETTGARAILAWDPGDRFRATLTAVYEEKEYGGAAFAEFSNALTFPPNVAPPATNIERYEHSEGTNAGGGDRIALFSLGLDYDFAGATLTSMTSYWDRTEELDLSLSITAFPVTGQPDTVPITNFRSDNPQVFTQEFRLTSGDEGRVDWLAGLFYQEIDQDHSIFAVDQSGLDLVYFRQVALAQLFGAPPPATRVVADNRANFVDEQIAVFGQLGFDFTSRWHAAASFRWFTLDQEFVQTTSGFQFGVVEGLQRGENEEDVFTPRVEVSFKPDESQLWYASASEGFRTGIINRDIPGGPICGTELANIGFPDGAPPTDADTVLNYELGTKLDLLDGRLRFNAAAYYIDWRDMQMNVPLSAFKAPGPIPSQCAYDIIVNAGDATTQGAELEVSALLTRALRLDVALSYVNAEYDDTIPQLNIAAGDPLPLTPEFTSFVGLQWDFDMGTLPFYLRAEWQYVGEKEPLPLDFPQSQYPQGVPFTIGDYDQVNVRAGVGLTDRVSLQVFVDNAFDEFAITSESTTGGIGYPFLTTIRPRTYGATLRVRF